MPWLLAAGGLILTLFFIKKGTDLPAASMPLDATLTADQKASIRFAIRNETSTDTLFNFALVLNPQYPLAVAALRKRADELGSNGTVSSVADMTPSQFITFRSSRTAGAK